MTRASSISQARHAGEHIHHFRGGLVLRHNKKISCETPVTHAGLPEVLIVPLLQHSGEVAEPRVKAGDSVLKGDLIGDIENRFGSSVHAPTSGMVEAVGDRPMAHPSGNSGPCVVIRPDHRDRWKTLDACPDWRHAEPDDLTRCIAAAGIVGLGGAVFPTHRKVSDGRRTEIHTLILNGAECEPYISCDEMLMREHPDRIVTGALILQHALKAKRVIIAIEDQMGVVKHALRAAIDRQADDDISVVRIPTVYPEGGEKQLVKVLTGLEVPSGGRPTDLGLLCQNVGTAAAVADAVTEDKPLIERVITITGNGVKAPRNLLALIGTPISHLVEQAGGYARGAARLVVGGPMMGYAIPSDDLPVIKASNCILVLGEDDIRSNQAEMPCINCGECARVCPALLMPQTLNRNIRNGLWPETQESGLFDCIECGCCDFVCPSHIPLVQWFRFGKGELRQQQDDRERAEAARLRHDSRQGRLQREKHERAEKRAQKKAALRDKAAQQRKLQEAVARVSSRQESRAIDPPADADKDKS
jgi:electron transport complex protein RnfC